MKNPTVEEYKENLKAQYGPLSEIIEAMEDPFAGAALLHVIEKEKNSTNLIVKEINTKFDAIIEKLNMLCEQIAILNKKFENNQMGIAKTEMLSERDIEILNFIKEKGKVCADDIKREFAYRGRNAASARMSKLFKDNILEKVYVGRKVYYKIKSEVKS